MVTRVLFSHAFIKTTYLLKKGFFFPCAEKSALCVLADFLLKVEDFFTLGAPVFEPPCFREQGKKYSETFGSIWLDVGML